MPSTFSTSLRLELIATGEQAGTWGLSNNNNLGVLLEQAISGVAAVVVADANYTLSAANGITDEARNQVLSITSSTALTASRNLVIPGVKKTYTVRNITTGGQDLVVRVSGQAGATVPNGCTAQVYCDGTTTVLASAPYNAATGALAAAGVSTGALTTTSLTSSGPISGTTITASGAMTAASLTTTGAVSAATLGVSGLATLTTLSVTGSSTLTGNVGVVGTLAAGNGLGVQANTSAFAIDLYGRPSDQVSALRWLSQNGATEYARLQSIGAAGLIMTVGASGSVSVMNTDAVGNTYFQHALTVQAGGLFVAAGGLSVTAGGLVVGGGGASITGNALIAGDITAYRPGAPSTGAVFLGNSGGRYLFWDGSNYQMPGGGLFVNGSAVYTAATFSPSSYLPLSGGVLSGPLEISVSGAGQLALTYPGVKKGFLYVGADGALRWQDQGGTVHVTLDTGGNLSTQGAVAAGTNLSASGSLSIAGAGGFGSVVTCLAPRGAGGTGRAIVDNTSRFGPWGWVDAGAFINVDVDGSNRGIATFASDINLKQDIHPATRAALPQILQLDFIDFRYKPLAGAPEDHIPRLNQGGVSAQQAQAINPGWVDAMPDGTLMLNAPILLTNALQAIKELAGQVEELRGEIALLKAG